MMKYLAVFFMFWGHLIAWVTLYQNPDITTPYEIMPLWVRVIVHASLFCPPVMFFFITDGYKYTHERKKYAIRLLIFACITQPFDWLLFFPRYGLRSFNVIFTLFFGLLAIMAYESRLKLWLRIVMIVMCAAATFLMSADWEIFGVIVILFLHKYRDRPKARLISYAVIIGIWKGMEYFWELLGGTFGADKLLEGTLDLVFLFAAYFCMTTFYNGRKGKHPVFAKWFFYAFYPLHYLIIWAVAVSVKWG